MRHIVSRFFGRDGARFRITPTTVAASGVLFILLTALFVALGGGLQGRMRGLEDGILPDQRQQLPPGEESREGDAGSRAEQPLRGVHVVVDPGHGGHDRGACHMPSALIEKEINLDMALRLERALKQAGANVSLTRRDDTFLALEERARFANERSADLFISLHVNRYPSSDCFGAQTFYLPSSDDGRRLALLIQEELLKIYPPNYRQALPGDYSVLRNTHMPAALVEIGFVTSPVDRALMAQDDYREQVAAAIVAACIRFVQGENPTEARGTETPSS